MADRQENIFYNVIKNETSTTEVLCNLMQYKSFRKCFLEFVKKNAKHNFDINIETVKFEDFDTEKSFGTIEDNQGRGDLVLTYNDLDYIFEIKVIWWRKLTSNQPEGYLDYLKDQKEENANKRLFFLVPRRYEHEKQIREKEITILYWEDFIEVIRANGIDDVLAVSAFVEIIDWLWFYNRPIQFTSNELALIKGEKTVNITNSSVPKIMMELLEIVEDTHKSVQIKYKTEKITRTHSGYFFTIQDENNEEALWFGVDLEFWEKENVPLALSVSKESKYKDDFYKNNIEEIKFDDDNNYYCIPIAEEMLKESSVNKIVDLIFKVAKSIGLKSKN